MIIWHERELGHRCAHANYGLSCAQYESLMTECDGSCQICGKSWEDDVALVIDHDHRIGPWAVRGILCGRCNSFLDFPLMAGPARDAYLADPWHVRNPHHPVVPTPRAPTAAANALYEALSELTTITRNTNNTTAVRRAAKARAGEIGVALLKEGEMPSRVLAKAPFSDAHLRKLARQAGLPPARLGGEASPKVRARARGANASP